MIIAMRTVLIALFELLHVFAEDFAAFLAREDHFEGLFEVVGWLLLRVAFGTVEPLSAAGAADRDLGVEDVFARVGVS